MATRPLGTGGFPALHRPAMGVRVAAICIAAAAVVIPAAVVRLAPPPPYAIRAARPMRVVPPDEVPPVEPVKLADLTPDEARAYNAAIPFSTAANPAARPFRFTGSDQDLARARDCLAAGALYEAGDDTTGERAVAQVVLNRLRHPAFPKTVCGVVFQGSERSTGCQFTFSCDGALDRWQPSEAAWTRATEVAAAALAGRVFRPVGYSTHYHTDWVVPYWQASLDKVGRVATHLFFRWSGWWGTPPAFRFNPHEAEPVIAALAPLSAAHRADAAAAAPATLPGTAAVPTVAGLTAAAPGPVFITVLPKGAVPDQYALIALAACVGHPYCKYLAWVDRALVPASVPTGDQAPPGLAFTYLRDPQIGYDKPLWNCRLSPRPDLAQCMRGSTAAVRNAATGGLSGVRRRGAPVTDPATDGLTAPAAAANAF